MGQNNTAFPGDIKHSARTTDHRGAERQVMPIVSRTTTTSLRFKGNIPNAANRVLKTKQLQKISEL